MNKYLEKIANKVEFEPGVSYDLAKHELKVSQGRIGEHLKKKDSNQRLATGGLYGIMGAAPGFMIGTTKAEQTALAGLGGKDIRIKHLPGPDDHKQMHFGTIDVPAKKNLYYKMRNRISPKTFSRLGGALGATVGGLALGGLGYAIGGVNSWEKPKYKNQYIAKLEKKYQPDINKLEGWD